MKNQLRISPKILIVAATVAVSVTLAGCSGGATTPASPASAEGALASSIDLEGVEITVGSKEYTEQRILGQLLVQALTAAGAKVNDQTGLQGTAVARTALTTGEIDTYYEYTGTAWLNILQNTEAIQDADELFDAVREAEVENDITWVAPAPMNNTYAVGVTAEAAKETGVETISDFAELARTDPSQISLCSSVEFSTRSDGLPGLEEAYDFKLPESSIFNAESTVEFEAAEKGDCNFLRLDSTDARIAANNIVTLEDDENYFPVYNPAVNIRTDVYEAHKAEYDELFTAISELLTQEAILNLNAAVELDGIPAEKVAEDFLSKNGII